MTPKKLELRHLAAYLPYGLKCLHNGNIKEVTGIRNWIGWCYTITDSTGETNTPIQSCKPLLFPLSNLTLTNANAFNYATLELFLEEIANGFIPVIYWNQLLERHYDVFNLIPAGLAVDINSLEK